MENNEIEILEETNKKKGSKRPYVVAIVLALALVVTITATSYAYFSATLTNSKAPTNTVVTTGSMEIEFSDGAAVSLANALPGSYVEKTFSVKNVGSLETTYDVYMSELINDFEDKTDLVYTLTSNDGGYNVSTNTQVPAASSKIVNSHTILSGATHNYTLRISFKETSDNQNDNKGKSFSTIIRVNEVQEAIALPCDVLTDTCDLTTVGSEVRVGDEYFYVIGQEDANHVKLLSKYNLGVGEGFATPTNKQESTATGYVDGGTDPWPGSVVFSSTNYWNESSKLKSQYGTSYPAYVYDRNSTTYQYVEAYVDYLETLGASVTGRLISYEELVSLGCYVTPTNTCSSAPSWVWNISYWSGSAYSHFNVWVVSSSGRILNSIYSNFHRYGVRPVIILEK